MSATFDEIAAAVRAAALGKELDDMERRTLVVLGLATVKLFGDHIIDALLGVPKPLTELTDIGREFDDAWTVFDDRVAADAILRNAYLGLPETAGLVQGLHGRQPVSLDGALHLLARHGLADAARTTEFRAFLQRLNDLAIVAYSKKLQSVRVLVAVPQGETGEVGAEPPVRVIERDRPYSNVRHLRETLRSCRDYIWWVDAHFSRKGLEPLTDEANGTRITEIRILSGPAQVGGETAKDFARFKNEMVALGISAEWRVVERADQEFHDRFIVTNGKAWNVPPINTLYKGDYSEISVTGAPPFEAWWLRGRPLPV